MSNIQLNTIYNENCLETMKRMPDNFVDLILTDPPYGINADKGVGGYGSSSHTAKKYKDDWDSFRPTQAYFDEMLRVGKDVIIFGGNFFTDLLPVNGHWIVWDKVGEIKFDNPFSKCELAWTNIRKNTVNKYVVIQQGFISADKERYHPTQKPRQLFKGIINDYANEQSLIYDPFMGSGTTARACKDLGRNFIGSEISKEYCDIANKRLSQEVLL